MINPIVKMIAGWQGHATYGLDTVAQTILLKEGWTLRQFNSSEHPGVMKDDITPPKLPAWVLWADSSAPTSPFGGYAVCRAITLACGVFTSSTSDMTASSALADTAMRAALINMHLFNKASKSEPFRELEGIRILKVNKVTEDKVLVAKGRRRMWGFVGIELIAVDLLTASLA